jgi:hypothetical protein
MAVITRLRMLRDTKKFNHIARTVGTSDEELTNILLGLTVTFGSKDLIEGKFWKELAEHSDDWCCKVDIPLCKNGSQIRFLAVIVFSIGCHA